MFKAFSIIDGKLIESENGKAQVYIYSNPDEKERLSLLNQSLDEHTLTSSLDPEEVGRIEFEDTHLAAIIKRPRRYHSEDNFLFRVSSVGLFLFPDKLIIIMSEGDILAEGKIFSKTQTVQDLFLRIIFQSLTHFEGHLKVIHKMSDELELEINQALSNRDLLHMFKLEKSLVYYLDAINSNNKVVEKLKNNAAKLGFSKEVTEFLDDLIIEGNQCLRQAETYSEVLSGMMDAWASIINNNLNIRIKTLTILSLCIMTPTLVVSLFSMNVDMPLPHGVGSFWIVVALAAVSVAILVGIFSKKW